MESIAIFTGIGVEHLFRWGHFLFGVAWIGMLWYFNFVQGAYFKEAEAAAKNDVTLKLLPKALWYFRWGAMGTFLTGVALLGLKAPQFGLTTEWGTFILTGALMGTIMFLNVWLIIWPAQRVIMASTEVVVKGGSPDPRAAGLAAKALLASRTNTMFSIPLLFFMGAAPHLPLDVVETNLGLTWSVVLLIVGALEFNALKGKLGPLTTVKGVIHCGLALTVLLYAVLHLSTLAA